ncbi:MAG: methylmalonyl-CoA mutase family protein [Chloroflexota bacterium]
MADLDRAARGADNTMPAFLECVESHATIGEICDVLRKVWGEYKEQVVV